MVSQENNDGLIQDLASESEETRDSAIAILSEMSAEALIGPLCDLIMQQGPGPVQTAYLSLMEQLGAAVSLDGVVADDWFPSLLKNVDNADKICAILGDRFLAYAVVLGIQVRSLSVDPRFPANSQVEFSIGPSEPLKLTLGEFRLRVVQALLRDPPPAAGPPLPLTVQAAVGLLNGRNLLAAPLFKIRIKSCLLRSLDPKKPAAVVGYVLDGQLRFQELGAFSELIKGKIRQDITGTEKEPIRLDLGVVPIAQQAFDKGDFQAVVATLQSWPAILTVLQRTPMARELSDEQRASIGEGLGLLGAAFKQLGRTDWSEELLKLGLQFSREGAAAAKLFYELGILLQKKDRFAESIALFRRALALGVPEDQANPPLGRAFLRTGRQVAAIALLEDAVANGNEDGTVKKELEEALEKIRNAGLIWDVPPRTMADRSEKAEG